MINPETYDKHARQYKDHCLQRHDFDIGGINLDVKIIGGADGPTSVFITGSGFYVLISIIALCIVIAVYLIHRKRNRKRKAKMGK